jgi:hypothetical protein
MPEEDRETTIGPTCYTCQDRLWFVTWKEFMDHCRRVHPNGRSMREAIPVESSWEEIVGQVDTWQSFLPELPLPEWERQVQNHIEDLRGGSLSFFRSICYLYIVC